MVLRILRDAGVGAKVVDADHVRIGKSILRADVRARAPYSGELTSAAGARLRGSLLITPPINDATAAALDALRISHLDTAGRVGIGGDARASSRATRTSRPTRRRSAPATSALLRELLVTHHAPSQHALAASIGVSQPRVSTILRNLQQRGLVHRNTVGWAVADRAKLLAAAENESAGWGVIEFYWYGLDDPRSQVREVARHAEIGRVAVSGDVAADLIAPWRAPTSALIYTDPFVDPSAAGLAPVDTAAAATLIQRLPADKSVYSAKTAAIDDVDVTLADIAQVITDLGAAGGSDRVTAADLLRRGVLA